MTEYVVAYRTRKDGRQTIQRHHKFMILADGLTDAEVLAEFCKHLEAAAAIPENRLHINYIDGQIQITRFGVENLIAGLDSITDGVMYWVSGLEVQH